jgi:molybdate transport repressor ModE-like protein
MRLDLIDLRLFMHVAEEGNMTRGATRSNMALASASERIRGMESLLGVSLLERSRRGVRLSAAGNALLHHARLILQQFEYMRDELGKYAHGLKSCIRILANSSALSEFLPELLTDFLAQHQNIDLDIEERTSFQIVRAVAEGFVDIGIVADIVDFGILQTFELATDRLVLVTSKGHRFARRRRAGFHELLMEEFVGLPTGSALQQSIAQHALQTGQPLKVRARLKTFESICRMVERDIGVAIIPARAALRCRQSMEIKLIPLKDAWSLRHLHVCARNFDNLPTQAQELVRLLRAETPKQAN